MKVPQSPQGRILPPLKRKSLRIITLRQTTFLYQNCQLTRLLRITILKKNTIAIHFVPILFWMKVPQSP
ncbi:hypothetical protein EMPG_14105 [Blastomyces silverae]|uniref:Uncharacterized protein n=1 Tax=Blastomyces silverae TaxID=2060906 RepID=A0A0H1BHC3_9EURO|nr:hypothetical protein EMPG_14105 [Blastomyces silverae]